MLHVSKFIFIRKKVICLFCQLCSLVTINSHCSCSLVYFLCSFLPLKFVWKIKALCYGVPLGDCLDDWSMLLICWNIYNFTEHWDQTRSFCAHDRAGEKGTLHRAIHRHNKNTVCSRKKWQHNPFPSVNVSDCSLLTNHKGMYFISISIQLIFYLWIHIFRSLGKKWISALGILCQLTLLKVTSICKHPSTVLNSVSIPMVLFFLLQHVLICIRVCISDHPWWVLKFSNVFCSLCFSNIINNYSNIA